MGALLDRLAAPVLAGMVVVAVLAAVTARRLGPLLLGDAVVQQSGARRPRAWFRVAVGLDLLWQVAAQVIAVLAGYLLLVGLVHTQVDGSDLWPVFLGVGVAFIVRVLVGMEVIGYESPVTYLVPSGSGGGPAGRDQAGEQDADGAGNGGHSDYDGDDDGDDGDDGD